MKKPRILVLCTGNSARSQMAEGLLRKLSSGKVEVESAGIAPVGVNPLAVQAMKEIDIDIANQRSKSVEEFAGQSFDYVISVCDKAQEVCPTFPGAENIHFGFDDPAAVTGTFEEKLQAFRRVRNELSQRMRLLLTANKLA